MRITLLCLLASGCACAADSALDRMFDASLPVSRRNDACYSLRGTRDEAVRAAMLRAMKLDSLRSCAATNLRVAGAESELKQALSYEAAEIRATAARELGSFQDKDLLPALAKLAADPNLLVATNALYALTQYQDDSGWPYLEPLARKGGIVGIMALDRIYALKDPRALEIARGLLNNSEVPDRVAAMRVIGEIGDRTDLPALREIASHPEPMMVRQRGFGLMPAIDVSKAAKTTIAQIESRLKS